MVSQSTEQAIKNASDSRYIFLPLFFSLFGCKLLHRHFMAHMFT